MDNSRKASDILLALEAKLDQLTSMINAQDLNVRVLSNKLNLLMEQIKSVPPPPPPSKTENPYSVSAAEGQMPNVLLQNRNPQQMVKVSNDKLPLQENPQGFRRTSRSEASSRPPAPPQKVAIHDPAPPDMSAFKQQLENKAQPKSSLTPPPPPEPEEPEFKAFENLSPQAESTNKVAVTQRIIEKGGKSVFLAEVEVLDYKTKNLIFKTRTNGVGKWQAALVVGTYTVRISKRESVTKQKIEMYQDIAIDGKVSQLKLEDLIIG